MRRLLQLLFVVLIASWVSALQAPAYGQSLTCPAGGPGGDGGSGGVSLGGTGGTAQPGFATGGDGGDATGGRGGAGGSGTLPICNQNTNGFDPGAGAAGSSLPAPAASAPVLGPVGQPVAAAGASGQTLGSTGAPLSFLAFLAGAFLAVGGLMLFVALPRRRAVATFVAEVAERDPSPDEIWARYGRPASPDNAAEAHARRLQRAQRRQTIIRRPAPADPFPHLESVVEKWANVS